MIRTYCNFVNCFPSFHFCKLPAQVGYKPDTSLTQELQVWLGNGQLLQAHTLCSRCITAMPLRDP